MIEFHHEKCKQLKINDQTGASLYAYFNMIKYKVILTINTTF